MDYMVGFLDDYILDAIYQSPYFPSILSSYFAIRTSTTRQLFTLWLLGTVGGALLYFGIATISYLFVFDHNLKKHPKYLENQIQKEITMTLQNIPIISILTIPWWYAELQGYSKLYDNVNAHPGGWWFMALSAFTFLAFTDMLIYFIHRAEHHPSVYWWLHKPHHLWKIPTPFASHAFHPLDGYLQSLPYHIYVFLFPLHSWLYLGLFWYVNVWTISIHDGAHVYGGGILNGTAHHTIHHAEFSYNYGQYFTLWDRVGGSYKYPEEEYKKHMVWHREQTKKQIEEMNEVLKKSKIVGKENGHANGDGVVNADAKHDDGKVNGHVSDSTSTPLRRSNRR